MITALHGILASGAAVGESIDFALIVTGTPGSVLTTTILASALRGDTDWTPTLAFDALHPGVSLLRTTIETHALADDDLYSLGGVNLPVGNELAIKWDETGRTGLDQMGEGFRLTYGSGAGDTGTISLSELVYLDAIGEGMNQDFPEIGGGSVWFIPQHQVPSGLTDAGRLICHSSEGNSVDQYPVEIPASGWYRRISRLNLSTGRGEFLLINRSTRKLIAYCSVALPSYTGGIGYINWWDYIGGTGGISATLGVRVKYGFLAGNWTLDPIANVAALQTDVNEATVIWDQPAFGLTYAVERQDNGGSFVSLSTTATLGTYVDTTLSDGLAVIYRVTVLHEGRTSNASSDSITIANTGGTVAMEDLPGFIDFWRADQGVLKTGSVAAGNNDDVDQWVGSINGIVAAQTSPPKYITSGVAFPVIRCSALSKLVASLGPVNIGTIYIVVGNVDATAPAAAAVIIGATNGSGTPRRLTTFYPDAVTIFAPGDINDVLAPISTWVNNVATTTFPGSGASALIVQQSDAPKGIDGDITFGQGSINGPFIGDILGVALYTDQHSTGARVSGSAAMTAIFL